MAMAVLELSAVFDAYERELGEEEAHDVVSMAYIGVGGYFWNDPESSDLSLAELAAFIADGKTYGESRAKLRRRITQLGSEEHIAEDVQIAGIVRHVERRLEASLEDMRTSGARNERQIAARRERLQNPVEREAQSWRIATLDRPEMPRIIAEDMIDGVEEMIDRSGAPGDLKSLNAAETRLDTWRRVTARTAEFAAT